MSVQKCLFTFVPLTLGWECPLRIYLCQENWKGGALYLHSMAPDTDPKPISPRLLCPSEGSDWLLSSAGHGVGPRRRLAEVCPPRPSPAPQHPPYAHQLVPCQHHAGSGSPSWRREFHVVWKAALPAIGSPKGLESPQHTEKYGPRSSVDLLAPTGWAGGGPVLQHPAALGHGG